ncbi:MAG: protein kinase [Chloroflexales bacterium]|nr:protein kinase [Chloroflexales bacterium]
MTTTLLPETLLHNRYRIVRAVGQGGMGAVYEAIDTRLGNTVALKQTLVRGEEWDAAFAREARLLSSLRHAALPVVSDYFAEGEGHFLVMQFIPGSELATLLAQRTAPFALDEVLEWADQLLDALDYLHTQQPPVIHRDIKPQNLKLTPRGEVVLLDFGLAKSATSLAGGASVFGYTPQYAPLEQVRGSGTDARSDLYALAATLYALLTNSTPVNALDRAGAVLSGQPDPLPPLRALNPHVPPALSDLLMRCLAINAADRPQSAAAVRAKIVTAVRTGSAGAPTDTMTFAVQQPPPAPPTILMPQPQRRSGWIWALVAAATVLVLACLGGVGFLASTLLNRTAALPTSQVTPIVEVDPSATARPNPPAATIASAPTPTIGAIVLPTDIAQPIAPSPSSAGAALTIGGEGTGDGFFQVPRGIAVAADGSIFVSDYTTGRVQKFDAAGSFVRGWISEGETPILALAADRAGRVYVSRNSGVQRYDGATGKLLDSFATGEGFQDLAILSDGSMLAIPWAGDDLVRLDEAGNVMGELQGLMEKASAERGPSKVAVDGLGTIYLLDQSGANVFIFTPEGAFKDRFAVPNTWAFSDLAVDRRGRLYVSTFGQAQGVAVFDADGRQVDEIGTDGAVFDMTFDDANNLYTVTAQQQAVKFVQAQQ